MTPSEPVVVIGLLDDPTWGPTLRLLARGPVGLDLLEKAFSLHRSRMASLELSGLEGVESEAGAELILDPVGTGKPTLAKVGGYRFAIGGSDDDWAAHLQLLHSLDGPGIQGPGIQGTRFQFLDYENPGKVALVVELVEP